MADKEVIKKKKIKKKEEVKKEDAPSADVEDTKSPASSIRASRGSRKVKRAGSSVFSMFTEKQVAEFKEAFQLMDQDKDGIIGRQDLKFIFNQVGRPVTDRELEEMLGEAAGPINFTQLLQLFASRMSGSSADDDDAIARAFHTFDVGTGKIDGDRLRFALMTWGEKFSSKEINEAFDNFYIDDKGFIDIESLTNMLTGKNDEDEE